MVRGFATFSALAATVALAAGCTVHQSDSAPPLTGPSDFAQSIRVTSNPDRLTQDGASQSAITIQVFDATGAPSPNVPVRVDMLVNGTLVDFGTLSARNVVTGPDGRASVVYKAPPAPPSGSGDTTATVTIRAIAVGDNAQTANAFSTDIRLVPPGVILPPAGTPTASFTFSPTPANANVPLFFDASASTPGTNASSLTYSWTFGDGSSATGRTVTKTFTTAGSFNVTLTVTNDRGLAASTTQAITVGSSGGPTAVFVFSPTQPAPGQVVFFNASQSRAEVGRTIVRYSWNWGDGETAVRSDPTERHDFASAGIYRVTLTTTDDLGRTATSVQDVPVGVVVESDAGARSPER